MPETKHSPGPWHYNDKAAAIYDENGETVLTIFIDCEAAEDEAAQINANATFAAASPRMFAALHKVRRAIESGLISHKVIREIDGAIAEAKGETNA